MQLKNSQSRYGAVAQLFHWVIVALIVTQFVLASQAEDLPRGPALLEKLGQHKSVGMTILMVAALRLVWRWLNPVPAAPLTMPRWQQIASHVTHGALYALLFIIPLFGWMMSSARNFPVSWFGLFTFPDLIRPGDQAYEFFHEAHEAMARVLFVLALLHIAAALKHHFFDRDNVLRRMLPLKLKSDGRI